MNPFADGSRVRFRRGAVLTLGLLLLAGLTACSTPQTRARRSPAVYGALSKPDRRLVLQGGVHDGMSRDAVFIAWGQPDFVHRKTDKSTETETWIYERQITQLAPLSSYEDRTRPRTGNLSYRSPGFDSGPAFSAGPYAGRSFFQPGVLVLGYRYRKAEFVGGKLKAHSDWGPLH